MPERDAHDPHGASPPTPRVLQLEPAPEQTPAPSSNTRVTGEPALEPEQEAALSAPSDTLLSAGPPANPLELLLEDRMAAVDLRLRELDARIAQLELSKPASLEPARTRPWLWLVFLVALAALFQLLRLAQ